MKKISIIIIIMLILISIIQIIPANAVEKIENIEVYSKGITDSLLIRDGIRRHTYVAVYKKDGIEYPAYCLNRELPGVEVGNQYLDTDSLVNNSKVWNAVVNGYPYKTISELGCQTEDEAYLATKQAIYCILEGIDVNSYSADSESGERTLNALKQIVKKANSSNSKPSSELYINSENTLWEVDNLNSNYLSQVFTVSANAHFSKFNVNVQEKNIEGLKIVDLENIEKTEFNNNEKFKVLLPIKNLKNDGYFVLGVNSNVATKPVLYGVSKDPTMQNYALTGEIFEDGVGASKIYYQKNETGIIINKTDGNEKNVLRGVEFDILDENQNVIYSGLTTDENGQIKVDNLLPGRYFVKETRTLLGYDMYNKLVEINLELNEVATVNIINSIKEEEVKIESKKSELTVKNQDTKTTVQLPKTGM